MLVPATNAGAGNCPKAVGLGAQYMVFLLSCAVVNKPLAPRKMGVLKNMETVARLAIYKVGSGRVRPSHLYSSHTRSRTGGLRATDHPSRSRISAAKEDTGRLVLVTRSSTAGAGLAAQPTRPG